MHGPFRVGQETEPMSIRRDLRPLATQVALNRCGWVVIVSTPRTKFRCLIPLESRLWCTFVREQALYMNLYVNLYILQCTLQYFAGRGSREH